jgi:hypothetical protein
MGKFRRDISWSRRQPCGANMAYSRFSVAWIADFSRYDLDGGLQVMSHCVSGGLHVLFLFSGWRRSFGFYCFIRLTLSTHPCSAYLTWFFRMVKRKSASAALLQMLLSLVSRSDSRTYTYFSLHTSSLLHYMLHARSSLILRLNPFFLFPSFSNKLAGLSIVFLFQWLIRYPFLVRAV